MELYKILHEAEIEATSKWGEEFGQQDVPVNGHGINVDPLTGVDLGWMYNE